MRRSQWQVADPDMYGCELWLGKTDRDGYGVVFNGSGPPRRAHRIAYEAAHGTIPAGMEVEHRCRRRACVRVAHLTLVTRSGNERSKRWGNRVRASHCDAGHDMFENGIRTPEGGRVCRRCSGLR